MNDASAIIGLRVLVIGVVAGSGKSTFSRALSARTGLLVVQLDYHYWKPGWTKPSDDEWRDKQRSLLAGDARLRRGAASAPRAPRRMSPCTAANSVEAASQKEGNNGSSLSKNPEQPTHETCHPALRIGSSAKNVHHAKNAMVSRYPIGVTSSRQVASPEGIATSTGISCCAG